MSRFAPIPIRPGSFRPDSLSPSFINSALKNEIWKIPNANIRILDVVRLVHGYFIFVTFESEMAK